MTCKHDDADGPFTFLFGNVGVNYILHNGMRVIEIIVLLINHIDNLCHKIIMAGITIPNDVQSFQSHNVVHRCHQRQMLAVNARAEYFVSACAPHLVLSNSPRAKTTPCGSLHFPGLLTIFLELNFLSIVHFCTSNNFQSDTIIIPMP